MAFEEQLPEWEAEGTQPPKTKRMEGWNPAEKPPASWFNWLFHRTYKALQELQQKAAEKVDVQVAQQIAQQAEQTAQQAVQTASQTAGALASHLNDFAQVWSNRIVEMGSNANGTYVRWENGLQMCWIIFTGVLDPNAVLVDTWTHPAAFAETPAKFIGSGTGSTNIHYQTVGINTTTGVSDPTKTEVVRRNLGSSSPISVVAYVLAIGRWK